MSNIQIVCNTMIAYRCGRFVLAPTSSWLICTWYQMLNSEWTLHSFSIQNEPLALNLESFIRLPVVCCPTASGNGQFEWHRVQSLKKLRGNVQPSRTVARCSIHWPETTNLTTSDRSYQPESTGVYQLLSSYRLVEAVCPTLERLWLPKQ